MGAAPAEPVHVGAGQPPHRKHVACRDRLAPQGEQPGFGWARAVQDDVVETGQESRPLHDPGSHQQRQR